MKLGISLSTVMCLAACTDGHSSDNGQQLTNMVDTFVQVAVHEGKYLTGKSGLEYEIGLVFASLGGYDHTYDSILDGVRLIPAILSYGQTSSNWRTSLGFSVAEEPNVKHASIYAKGSKKLSDRRGEELNIYYFNGHNSIQIGKFYEPDGTQETLRKNSHPELCSGNFAAICAISLEATVDSFKNVRRFGERIGSTNAELAVLPFVDFKVSLSVPELSAVANFNAANHRGIESNVDFLPNSPIVSTIDCFQNIISHENKWLNGQSGLRYKLGFALEWDVHKPAYDSDLGGVRLVPHIAFYGPTSTDLGTSIGFYKSSEVHAPNAAIYAKGNKRLSDRRGDELKIYYFDGQNSIQIGKFCEQDGTLEAIIRGENPELCSGDFATICAITLEAKVDASRSVKRPGLLGSLDKGSLVLPFVDFRVSFTGTEFGMGATFTAANHK